MGQLIEFIEKAMSDKELKAKLDALAKKDGDSDEVIYEKDDIIALANENGFTVTAEDIKMREQECTPDKETTELKEEELEAVSGGGWPTQNRYDPKTCKGMTRTKYECVGFAMLCFCDHYIRHQYGRGELYNHHCKKSAFPEYVGSEHGWPRKY